MALTLTIENETSLPDGGPLSVSIKGKRGLDIGRDPYLDWTLRLGDWYVATQEADGFWHPLREQTQADVIEVTLEFVMHLDTLIGALSSRPAAGGSAGSSDGAAAPASGVSGYGGR